MGGEAHIQCRGMQQMTADDFYEHFKAALKYLDLDWGSMDEAIVTIEGGKFIMTTANKSCILDAEDKA